MALKPDEQLFTFSNTFEVKYDLHMAVQNLNTDDILILLSEPNVNLTAIDKHGDTVLHSALKNKFNHSSTQRQIIIVLEILLDSGIDINSKNRSSETILHLAIDKRMKEVVKMLISRGADLNVRDANGNMLVHYFMNKICQRKLIGAEGSADFLDFLREQGVDINSKNSSGETVMSIAVKNNLISILTMCLSYMKNTDFIKIDNLNSLFRKIFNCRLAIRDKNERKVYDDCLVMLISKGAGVNRLIRPGLNALQSAFHHKNVNLMLMLEKHGADLNVLKNNDYLHRLCTEKISFNRFDKNKIRTIYDDMTEFLVRAGCDINGEDSEGRTPLFRATQTGNVKMVRALLASGADVNGKGSQESQITPLHKAIVDRNEDIFKILISANANVNSRNALRSTPLHFASLNDPPGMVETLLNAEAQVNLVDNEGLSPLSVAIKKKNIRVVDRLLNYGARIDDKETFKQIQQLIGPVSDSINKYCIKLQALGLPFLRKSQFYARNQFYQEFYYNCLKEIERLKNYKISNRVSIYDFLHVDWNYRCSFVNNEKLTKLLGIHSTVDKKEKSGDLVTQENEFPMYYQIISSNYNETVARRKLIEPAKCAWYNLTGIHLPELCVLRIIAHLPNDTLNVMIEGAEKYCLKRSLDVAIKNAVKRKKTEDA